MKQTLKLMGTLTLPVLAVALAACWLVLGAGAPVSAQAQDQGNVQPALQQSRARAVAAPPANSELIPGQYIVVLSDKYVDVAADEAMRATPGQPAPANPTLPDVAVEAQALAAQHGLRLGHVYEYALRGFSFSGPETAAEALARNPRVASVEPDQMMYALQATQTLPTGVRRIQTLSSSIANIDGSDQRVDVDVAVIDTGIDLDHPDLPPVVGGRHYYYYYDQTRGKKNASGPREDDTYDDDNGHGTHVAGTVAALDNGFGVVGVAPGARLWAVKVLDSYGSGQMSDIIKGIDFVTQHANEIEVANMSLGGGGVSDALRAAIQGSVAAGVVYVVAAGNSASDVYGADGIFGTGDEFIPAAYPEVAAISAMGDTDGLAGGAGLPTSLPTADDTFASFTNFSSFVVLDAENPVYSPGAAIDLAAPGVDIYSTLPNGTYGTGSGTSMAAPHVAGAAALEIAAHGRATNAAGVAEIRQTLIDFAQAQSFWGPANTLDPDANAEGLADVTSRPANARPVVSISSPATGAVVDSGAVLEFAGTATDTEDGVLDAVLEWSSDLDGVIGVGAGYSTVLSDGVHTIVALAIDSGGKTGRDRVTVTVGEAPPPPVVWNKEIVVEELWFVHSLGFDFDRDWNPGIGYATNGLAKLAHWTGTEWSVETVGPLGTSGGYTLNTAIVDMAYDPTDGNPSLCYIPDSGKLSFVHWNGASWQFQVVESRPILPDNRPLVYDLSGKPTIAYRLAAKSGVGLQFARWNGSAWAIETPDAKCYPRYKSLAYDGNGRPAIAYSDDTDGDGKLNALKLARWNGSTWTVEIVREGGPGMGVWASLAFDPISGYPAMVHAATPVPRRGEFVYWTGTQWATERYDDDPSDESGVNCSLAFDADGTAMVSYGFQLRFAKRVNGAWQAETVDAGGSTYEGTPGAISLKLKPGSEGRRTAPAIAYRFNDASSSYVKFAVRQQ